MEHPPQKLMVITWLDHFSRSTWHGIEDVDLEPLEVMSVGWVTGEDDTMIALVSGISMLDRAPYRISILKCAIVESYEVVF